MEHGSLSNSSAPSDSAEGVRRLVFPELEGLNVEERPWSALSVGRSFAQSASSAKRRKISSADGRSPLGWAAKEDDRLLRLERKLEESERERKEMLN